MVDLFVESASRTPSEVSSDRAPYAFLHRGWISRWSEYNPKLRIRWRPNRALDNWARVHRFTRPNRFEHTLKLEEARFLVAVLQRCWEGNGDFAAQRVVSFLVIGQK